MKELQQDKDAILEEGQENLPWTGRRWSQSSMEDANSQYHVMIKMLWQQI